jgi:type I restriction enzyme S subunit
MRPYDCYKSSGSCWMGSIPSHWSVSRIKNSVVECRNGIWGNEADGSSADIVCIRVADFDRVRRTVRIENPTLRKVTPKELEPRLVLKGDLLLEKSGGGEGQPVGAVVLYDHKEPAVCSNFVARMRLAPHMEPSFWNYVHFTIYDARLNIRSIKQTSGIQNLDQSQYLNEVVAFPPLPEQQAIAAFLDRETGKIDALIKEQRRLIALLKEKRQAVISHAVTKGLDPTAPHKPSGIDWLGDIPAHWEVRSINSLSNKITNGYVGPTRGILVAEGVKYLQSLHIKRNGIRFEKAYFVTEEWSNHHAKSILQAEDVLIVQTGDIGQVAVVTDEFVGCNCHALIIVAPDQTQASGRWLTWVLASNYGQHVLHSIKTGALHPHLNCGNVKFVACPVPPLEEQEFLIAYLEKTLGRFDELEAEATRAIALLQERRAALISAAVTGKIDVRAAVSNDEEAA